MKLGSGREIVTTSRSDRIFTGTGRVGTGAGSDSGLVNLDDLQVLPVLSQNGTALPPYTTVYTFQQLIDHTNPGLGTFAQRYYFTWEFWEPGGPIFFTVPSEAPLDRFDGSITNSTIGGHLAQNNKGAAVVLEHRFFGESNPYPDLSEDSLAVLTLDQNIQDIVNFAQNAVLPMPDGDKAKPNQLPWVLIGGSYAGAMVAWTMTQYPNIFAAGWASSAVVEAQNYFWSYFDIIRQFAPANCTADLEAVVTFLDVVFTNGTEANQTTYKQMFGLGNVKYGDDVMDAIRAPIYSWQDFQPGYEDRNAGFNAFCNYLEYDRVARAYDTTGRGVGLEQAIEAYGSWIKSEISAASCVGREEACYGTHDNTSTLWASTALKNDYRSWSWLYCNQFGWLFSGAPANWSTISTRLSNPDTEMRLCSLFFPKRFPFGISAGAAVNNTAFNNKYGGWDIKTKNVFFANGKLDPWRGVTLSSDLHNRKSNSTQPIVVADGGFHCSDLSMQQGDYDDSVKTVQDLGAAYTNLWLRDWYNKHENVTRPNNTQSYPNPSTIDHPTFVPAVIPQSIINATWVGDNPALGNAAASLASTTSESSSITSSIPRSSSSTSSQTSTRGNSGTPSISPINRTFLSLTLFASMFLL
ncbi:hypothetical protein FRC02_009178 [Tulasnella sp. 418]|nr:hypothetical protein FRC02_009178 [Tulasnella sp. 418]